MTAKTTITAVDGTDALAFVIIRPGKTPGGVAIEAAANGIGKEGAAYVLRNVANEWDGGGDDHTATLAALNTLAERYEETAAKAVSDVAKARARQISQAARDIRTVLTTGRIPHWLMTDAELEAAVPIENAEIVEENAS